MYIHPTAIISDLATIGENFRAGPYSIVEEGVSIGDNCEIAAQGQVRRGSHIGNDCYIGSGAIISADPHYLGFDRELETGVVIGDRNTFREYVTVHRSIYESKSTQIGSDNFFMSGAHVGHDCQVGDHNVLANNVLLGGHVDLRNHCFLGGGAAFHQFVRIGDYVMAQGHAGMSHDVPPFTICAGINGIAGLNSVGIRRAGFPAKDRKGIKEAFRRVYREHEGAKSVITLSKKESWGELAETFLSFLQEESKKGVCMRWRTS